MKVDLIVLLSPGNVDRHEILFASIAEERANVVLVDATEPALLHRAISDSDSDAIAIIRDSTHVLRGSVDRLAATLGTHPEVVGVVSAYQRCKQDGTPAGQMQANRWKFWDAVHTPQVDLGLTLVRTYQAKEAAHGVLDSDVHGVWVYQAYCAMQGDFMLEPAAVLYQYELPRLVDTQEAKDTVMQVAYSCGKCRARLYLDVPQPVKKEVAPITATVPTVTRSCCGH